MKNKKKILLIFGPQGSGNHLFARIFSMHPDVHGWQELLEVDYHIPHDQEPFAIYWNDIEKINKDIFGDKNYGIISVSVPFWGKDGLPDIPKVYRVMDKFRALDYEVQPVLIGRDKNILTFQQERRRGGPSWGCMHQLILEMREMPFFISYELLYMYKEKYLKSLSHWLDFPIAFDDSRLLKLLSTDQNAKYVKSIIDFPKTELELKSIGMVQRPYWELEQ